MEVGGAMALPLSSASAAESTGAITPATGRMPLLLLDDGALAGGTAGLCCGLR